MCAFRNTGCKTEMIWKIRKNDKVYTGPAMTTIDKLPRKRDTFQGVTF